MPSDVIYESPNGNGRVERTESGGIRVAAFDHDKPIHGIGLCMDLAREVLRLQKQLAVFTESELKRKGEC